MKYQVTPAPWHSCLCFLVFVMTCIGSASAAQPTAFDNWARTAKIGGAAIAVGMSQQEIDTMLDTR